MADPQKKKTEKTSFTAYKRIQACLFLLIAVCAVLLASFVMKKNGESASLTEQTDSAQLEWYEENQQIAHALGIIDEYTYTNSREALEFSYAEGFRVFECDFLLTADNVLVACHDWEEWKSTLTEAFDADMPTREEFMSLKRYGLYTALTVEDLLQYMEEHPDIWVVTDNKYLVYEDYSLEFQILVDTAVSMGCEDALDRFIVQIYYEDMLANIQAIYPFQNWIYTLYMTTFQGDAEDFSQYAQFCVENGVDVITMWNFFYSEEIGELASSYGLEIFVHTVNDAQEKEAFLEQGVGVYTDVW